jgi:hypothetical protein
MEGAKQRDKFVPALNQLNTKARRHLGRGSIAPPFLTSVLDGGEWSASRPRHFTPEEIAHSTHCKGWWACHRTGLGAVEKRKNLAVPGIETRPSSPQPVAISTPHGEYVLITHILEHLPL